MRILRSLYLERSFQSHCSLYLPPHSSCILPWVCIYLFYLRSAKAEVCGVISIFINWKQRLWNRSIVILKACKFKEKVAVKLCVCFRTSVEWIVAMLKTCKHACLLRLPVYVSTLHRALRRERGFRDHLDLSLTDGELTITTDSFLRGWWSHR